MKMNISDWILLGTLIVALFAIFAERIWKYIDNSRLRSQIKTILISNFLDLKKELIRIREKRDGNNLIKEGTESLTISETSFSEINGYYFLFVDLILSNIQVFNFKKYLKTIEFFNHYKKNIETMRIRFKPVKEKIEKRSYITLNTFNKLIDRLDNVIDELYFN